MSNVTIGKGSQKLTTYSIRLQTGIKNRLEHEAEKDQRPVSFLVNAAIHRYLELKEEKRKHIRQRVKELDEGKLIPSSLVLKNLKAWSQGKKIDWDKIPN